VREHLPSGDLEERSTLVSAIANLKVTDLIISNIISFDYVQNLLPLPRAWHISQVGIRIDDLIHG
jgi:hypothetical protein